MLKSRGIEHTCFYHHNITADGLFAIEFAFQTEVCNAGQQVKSRWTMGTTLFDIYINK